MQNIFLRKEKGAYDAMPEVEPHLYSAESADRNLRTFAQVPYYMSYLI